MIRLKSAEEMEKLDRANRVVIKVLDSLEEACAPGIALRDLDALAERLARQSGAVPAFKGYRGFPASLCASLNDEVVHGIPGDRKLQAGDILSLDFGALLDGYYGDAARTVAIEPVDVGAAKLLRVTRESLDLGILQAREGNHVQDVSHAVQSHVESNGFSVVRDFVGHGVGTELHEEPQVPNFGAPGLGPRLQAGMVLAIEPMVNEGSHHVTTDGDGWTVRTRDHSRSAHFEHSIAVTPEGPRVLGVGGR